MTDRTKSWHVPNDIPESFIGSDSKAKFPKVDMCYGLNKSTYSIIGNDHLHNLNIVVSIWLVIFGIIGNTLAIIVTSPTKNRPYKPNKNMPEQPGSPITSVKKININHYILRWFHIVCLTAILTLICAPLLKEHGISSDNQLWVSKPWITYLAHVHYPLSKTLNAYTFLIYVVYFLNQIAAILYPFRYRTKSSLPNVRLALAIAFIYCFLWFLPIYKWQYITRSLICVSSNTSNLITKFYAYQALTWYPEGFRRTTWVTYDTVRELMVYIVPFALVFILKMKVIRRRRSRTCPQSIYIDQKIADVKTPTIVSQVSTITQNPSALNRVLLKRKQENRQHRRTLIILSTEFLFFMMPLCIMQISMNFAIKILNATVASEIYMMINLLQYAYIALTFFFNVIFNPYYRRTVAIALKDLYRIWSYKLKMALLCLR